MPDRPTERRKKKCKPQEKALQKTRELMEILKEELVEYLDEDEVEGSDYEGQVSSECNIDATLFENGKESELAKALNDAFDGSAGKCRQALLTILDYRTRGAILELDMLRTLELIDNFEGDFIKCLHEKRGGR